MTESSDHLHGDKSLAVPVESADLTKKHAEPNQINRNSVSQAVPLKKPIENLEPAPYFLRRYLKKTLVYFVAVLLTISGVLFVGRSLLDSLLQRIDVNDPVHTNNSVIEAGITREVRPQVILVYREIDGQLKRVLADEEAVSTFTRESINQLESARTELRNTVSTKIHAAVEPTFSAMRKQIEPYAEWYFAWLTTYKIMGEALVSAAQHALKPEVMSLKDAVAADVETYLQKRFEDIVLRPEISDAELNQAFTSVLQALHQDFLHVMAQQDQHFQKFVNEQTTRLMNPAHTTSEATVELDWDSQFKKVSMAGHEKGKEDALLGAGLVAGGAVLGKVIAAGSGKVAAGTALKALTAKLAAPFIGKTVSIAAPAAAGTAPGAVAGPIGAIVGAVAGLGVDYLISKGVEWANRDSFEGDTSAALNAIQREWEVAMVHSLEQPVDAWFEDTIDLFSAYARASK